MTCDRAVWSDVLTWWRAETVPALPSFLVVDDGDRALPLDLRCADDRELLRRSVGRGVVVVMEPPGGPGAIQAVLPGPSGRHLLELVVPLAWRETVPLLVRRGAVRRGAVRARDTGLYLPGGRWLSLAVRTPACALLLPSLAALAGDLAGHDDAWFWLRYHAPGQGPHIRVRFRGEGATLGSRVLPVLCAWCRERIRQRLSGGFTVESYDQESERYGGPAAIGAAEHVFVADSSLALAILASVGDNDQRLIIAALSAAALAHPLTDAYQAALDGRHLDRAARRHLLALRPQVRAARGQVTAGPELGGIRSAWSARHEALVSYRELLEPARRADCASSLIHLHLNRLLGDMRSERMVRALAADLLATPVMTSISRQHALATAERLLNTEKILAAVPVGGFLNGLAGTALLHARLAAVDSVVAQAALRRWAAAAQHPGPHRAAAGVVSSPGGLVASLIIGSAYLPDPDSQRAVTARALRCPPVPSTSPMAAKNASGPVVGARRGRCMTRSTAWLVSALAGLGPGWYGPWLVWALAGMGTVLLAALTAGPTQPSPGSSQPNARSPRSSAWHTGCCAGARTPHPAGRPPSRATNGTATPQRRAPGDATPGATAPPGIGRALILAGHALADPRLTTVGDAAIASLSDRPADRWDVEGPTVCHGYAGVLPSATTSQGGTGDSAATAVTEAFTPRLAFAFRHLRNGVPSDEPGLLTGSAGIALAFTDHGQLPKPPVPARGDSILLLS